MGRAVRSREHIVVCSLFLERRRQCKDTCVRKISKQKHLWEVITIKRKRFRQVKTINPFPLNKMFYINYRTAEDSMFYIDYKIAKFTTNCTVAEVYLR